MSSVEKPAPAGGENIVRFRTGDVPPAEWCQRSNQALDHLIQMACSASPFELDARDNAVLATVTDLKSKLYAVNQEERP